MFDVGSMKWSVALDANKQIPKDADGVPQLEGRSTGANDVGRMLESVESMTGGALTQGEIGDLHDAYAQAYRDTYVELTGTVIEDQDLSAATKLYRIETELAALGNGDKTALLRISNIIGESLGAHEEGEQ
jgi:hypothetical protein